MKKESRRMKKEKKFFPSRKNFLEKYGAQNVAYRRERGRKTAKAFYLQGVAMVEAMGEPQNEMFTLA
ncbi:MAG: hypothetical protein J5698_03410 [Bacteroidaceae bacterium]|nr:hypothetical protein [Bacteroidaceae bacterium]